MKRMQHGFGGMRDGALNRDGIRDMKNNEGGLIRNEDFLAGKILNGGMKPKLVEECGI